MGFGYLVAPEGRRERQQWFSLAGWVPEALLGQAGRFIPWRTLAEFPRAPEGQAATPEGLVVGLALSAAGLARWDPERRRRHLVRLVEALAGRGTRVFGLGRGLERPVEAGDPVRQALREVCGEDGATLVGEWAGRLAGVLAAAEAVTAARGWEAERAEVVLVGGETGGGQVLARALARRFGRLTLAGDAPALSRLAVQLMHETGTAARVNARLGSILPRADLVVLAAPWPAGAGAALRPQAVVLEAGAETDAGECRAAVVSGALFAWPAGPPTRGLTGTVWPEGKEGGRTLVAAGLAAVAAAASAGGEDLRLASGREPSLGGVLALRRALERSGFRPAALLDKGGAVLL